MPQKRRKDVTYGSFICTVCSEKDKPNQTHFTVDGNRINFPGEVATPTADMVVAKILLNNIISTCGAQFMTIDIKRPEYTHMKIDDLPKEIINKYKLRERVNKMGMIYIEVTKGMYGLPQAGLLTNELLKQ